MCAAEIPDPELDQGLEDTESIENDIDSLYDKFIRPIDAIRSIAEAPKDQNQSNQSSIQAIQNLTVDSVKGMESRVHAFYRMLGLPVVGGTAYYNPGFDPSPKSQQTRNSVNSNVSEADKELMNARELHPKLFQQMFAGQGFDTTAFGVVQSIPKPFNMLDDKEVAIDLRSILINSFKADLSTSLNESISNGQVSFIGRFGYPLTSSQHILKPFAVNPSIDYTVMPMNNKIAVPFLKDLQATKISTGPDVYLNRPGLEYILRARLKDNLPDKIFLANLEKALTKVKSPTTDVETSLDGNALKATLEAFAGEGEVADINLEEIFGGFSSTQATVVKQLVKTVKVVIKLLHKSVESLSKIQDLQTGITFLPISSSRGFENGGSNREYTGTKKEKDITTIMMKKLNADRDAELDKDIGNYSTSQFINLEKVDTYSNQLDELKAWRSELSSQALKHLRTIEIITGEASGFGLVDIIAVYTALWTIKIEDLLILLDQDSADRLYNFNVTLRSDAVTTRKNSPGSITDALTALEEKVVSILTFADKLYGESFVSAKATEGGSPA